METSPLADKIRPKTLDQVIGQEHLVGQNKPLRRIIETGQLFSMIFWGPPGTGKTTLARIVATQTQAYFIGYSAVSAKKQDVMNVVSEAKERLKTTGQRTILFIDEIHRFNKAQQDAFLPYVETGTIILIGATTENPSFEVISPLLSRCRVFVLNEISEKDLVKIINRGVKELKVKIPKDALEFLANFANGDARQALNLLEATYQLYQKITIENIKSALQSKFLRYDKAGEEHYNVISAFIKSMRASNVDAALYYLARMVDSGEDPLFIARRMVIFASEDIGIAQPTALVVANEVFQACDEIGYPECAINLAHGVVYLCQAKKDRSAYEAYSRALEDVKNYGNLTIPLKLRNAPTKLMKNLGYGKDYQKYDIGNLLPEELKNKKYYLKP
jgi:putative ATPase